MRLYDRLRTIGRRQDAARRQFEPEREVIPAVIAADANGETVWTESPNFTLVSEWNTGPAVPAFNKTGLSLEGTPVWLAKDPKSPYRREIIGINDVVVEDTSDTNIGAYNVGIHGQNHQMPSEGNLGSDPVKVYQPALQPLKTTGNGTSLTVTTQPLIYMRNGARKYFPGDTTDLTAYVPGAGLVRRVLVYLDEATNTKSVTSGTAVTNNGVIPIPYPVLPNNGRASAYVKLANAQTAVTTATHIDDARDFLRGRGSESGYTADQVGQVLFSTDGITFTAQLPMTNDNGWMINDEGLLLVAG